METKNTLQPNTKYGSIWSAEELDLIVADYFSMLKAELTGVAYVKSHRAAALMAQTGRSHRSVEFKHQNISAVLCELGLPIIPGYKPKENFQNAIVDAVDRYLSAHPTFLEMIPARPKDHSESSTVFVEAPTLQEVTKPQSTALPKLIRKFDPALRDLRNRKLGQAGEAFVVELERRRLLEADRKDLATKVRWVAAEDGDGAGYDVLSFGLNGAESLIEVKTTNGAARTPFFLTRNEFEMAADNIARWQIYRVHFFSSDPRIFTLRPPLESSVLLRPETWRASYFEHDSWRREDA